MNYFITIPAKNMSSVCLMYVFNGRGQIWKIYIVQLNNEDIYFYIIL